MTDDQFNQRFETVTNHIEALTNSLDRFETSLERLGEAQAQSEKRIDRLERVVKLAIRAGLRERRESRDKINALIEAQMRADQRMDALADAQMRTDERMDTLAAAMTEMSKSVTKTNKRIDAMKRNGKGKK